MDAMTRLAALLPRELLPETGALPDDLTELRIRPGRPVQAVSLSGETFWGAAATDALVREAARSLAGHSLYAREDELREGYFTMEGGCRVGVCGRMTQAGMTHIGSVCVRVAREIPGAADAVMSSLYEDGRPVSALVISPPGLGKTTLLRDIARQLSDGACGQAGVSVAIADERGELAGCLMGVPTMNIGLRTDVMDGCSKRQAMRLLLRAMSPKVIVTDEMGHAADAEAALAAMRSGVRVIASVHARDEAEAAERLGRALSGRFDRQILLGDGIGQVKRIVGRAKFAEVDRWM